MSRFSFLNVGLALLTVTAAASATTFRFDTAPFAGTDVLNIPGRQVVGGEDFLSFDTAQDVFSLDGRPFNVGGPVHFLNSVAGRLPDGGFNIVVLETFDDDNNPQTPFGAGNAANLIADRITTPEAGFFVYFNQGLDLARLVYSTDLSSNTADLQILARMLNLTGAEGRSRLVGFTAANFRITGAVTGAVPEPSTLWMVAPAFGLITPFVLRRKRGRRAVQS